MTCKTTKNSYKMSLVMKPGPNVSIELFNLISTQKAHKTCHKQGSKLHYLGTNQGLPHCQSGYDAMLVIVDRLRKSAHFLPMKNSASVEKLAKLYVKKIVRLHGTLVSIVSDKDPQFTSQFWPSLQRALGTMLHFSTTFHPQAAI